MKNRIIEFTYLNIERTPFYRELIRTMYVELQRKEFLYGDEIFEKIRRENGFEDYTLEQCYNDLDFLYEKKIS